MKAPAGPRCRHPFISLYHSLSFSLSLDLSHKLSVTLSDHISSRITQSFWSISNSISSSWLVSYYNTRSQYLQPSSEWKESPESAKGLPHVLNENVSEYAVAKLHRMRLAGVIDEKEQLQALISGLHYSVEKDFAGNHRPRSVTAFLNMGQGIPMGWKYEGPITLPDSSMRGRLVDLCIGLRYDKLCRLYDREGDAEVRVIWMSSMPNAWKKACFERSNAPYYAKYLPVY